jgi:hypothetical protein
MRIMLQRWRHRDDKGRPHNPSEFRPLPPKRVDLISPGNDNRLPFKRLRATERTQRVISILPPPKMALVKTLNNDSFLHIVPGVVSVSTGVLVKIA